LGKIGDPKAVPVLIAALEDEDSSVRWSAIGALKAFGHKAKAAVSILAQAVNGDESNGWYAAGAVGAIDAEGVSTSALIEALGNKSPVLRRFAAMGLSGIGRKAISAEPALHHGLQDSDLSARIAAAGAYWSVTGEADEAVSVLRSALQAAENWTERMRAASALGEIGPAAKDAVPDLIACLPSNVDYVVAYAAEALGKIGPEAASAVPPLVAKLGDEDDYVRVCAARALWRIDGSEQCLGVLEDAIKNSRDSGAVSEAARGIGQMGELGQGSTPLLRPLLKHHVAYVRTAAAEALKQIEPR
jgi:HEAT repeat protein